MKNILQIVKNVYTLLGTNKSVPKTLLKMIFLFQRWNMLVSWRVSFVSDFEFLVLLVFVRRSPEKVEDSEPNPGPSGARHHLSDRVKPIGRCVSHCCSSVGECMDPAKHQWPSAESCSRDVFWPNYTISLNTWIFSWNNKGVPFPFQKATFWGYSRSCLRSL